MLTYNFATTEQNFVTTFWKLMELLSNF